MAEIVADSVRRNAMSMSRTRQSCVAAKQVKLPIVFAIDGTIRSRIGYVASLARPGGNVTGFSIRGPI